MDVLFKRRFLLIEARALRPIIELFVNIIRLGESSVNVSFVLFLFF